LSFLNRKDYELTVSQPAKYNNLGKIVEVLQNANLDHLFYLCGFLIGLSMVMFFVFTAKH